MKAMPAISLVIPVLNGGGYLAPQWESFKTSGLFNHLVEIIYINDGSTDNTPELINAFRKTGLCPVNVISNESSKGRFLARLQGAEFASGSHILFLDSRLTISGQFSEAFGKLISEADCLMGHVDIDIGRNVFCLYWDRTHRVIFRKHFATTMERVVMNRQNVDQFLKGTTVFYTRRDIFINVCEKFRETPLLNDDTFIIEEIVGHTPLVLDPTLRINWVPRESMSAFLWRMWERGPSFVEYHVFGRRGLFFWIVSTGLFSLVLWMIVLVKAPIWAISTLLAFLALLMCSTVLFSHSLREFFLLVPVHVATVLTFCFGILWGIIINILRVARALRRNFS